MDVNILYLHPKKVPDSAFDKGIIDAAALFEGVSFFIYHGHSLKEADEHLSTKRYDVILSYPRLLDGSIFNYLAKKDPGPPIVLISPEPIDTDIMIEYNIRHTLSEEYVTDYIEGLCPILKDMAENEQNKAIVRANADLLETNNRWMELLSRSSSKMHSARSLEELYQALYGSVRAEVPCHTMTVSSYLGDKEKIRCDLLVKEGKFMDVSKLPLLDHEKGGKGLQSQVLDSGRHLIIDDIRHAPNKPYKPFSGGGGKGAQKRPKASSSALYVPIFDHDAASGVLFVTSTRKNDYGDSEAKLLSMIGREFVSARGCVSDRIESKRSESLYKGMCENAPLSFQTLDEEGTILSVNKAWTDMMGIDRKDVLGKRFSGLMTPASSKMFKDHLKRLKSEGRGREVDVELLDNRGDVRLLTADMGMGFDPGGETVVHCILKDITDKRELEGRLNQTQHATDTAGFIIYFADPDGSITYANDAACNVLGYSKGEMLGMPLHDIFPKFPAKRRKAHWKSVVDQKFLSFETTLRNNAGIEIPVLVCDQYVNYGGREFEFACVADITEQQRREQDIRGREEALGRLAEARLAELHRSYEELDQFAYLASHDIQESLRAVTLNLKMFKRKYADVLNESALDYILKALDGSQRIDALIKDLLSYSGVSRKELNMERFHALESVQGAIRGLMGQIESAKADISIGSMPEVYGDKALLTDLFKNLLSNAIKFKGDEYPKIFLSSRKMGDEHVFSIKDNGIGMDPDKIDEAFNLFHKLQNADGRPGNGIGLSVSKRIVERHNGRIWAKSAHGSGSTFYFAIPMPD